MIFQWVSHRENFLLRPTADGLYETHSDMVARVSVRGLDFRMVVHAGAALRRVRLGRARAALLRPKIADLPISPREKDDVYIMAIRSDGAPRVWLTQLWLRLRGYATKGLKYSKRP